MQVSEILPSTGVGCCRKGLTDSDSLCNKSIFYRSLISSVIHIIGLIAEPNAASSAACPLNIRSADVASCLDACWCSVRFNRHVACQEPNAVNCNVSAFITIVNDKNLKQQHTDEIDYLVFRRGDEAHSVVEIGVNMHINRCGVVCMGQPADEFFCYA